MNPEVEFHPAAEQELLDAEGWYAERSLIAARAFVQEVALVVERALAAPERWPIHLHGTRRVVFPRFPFSLIYRLREQRIQVIAVAHQSRRPGYWKDRV
ncbi:MAG: type II toxin-antitoxin system RelE/ParE family toxin [Candidatus Binatia bacterium]